MKVVGRILCKEMNQFKKNHHSECSLRIWQRKLRTVREPIDKHQERIFRVIIFENRNCMFFMEILFLHFKTYDGLHSIKYAFILCVFHYRYHSVYLKQL